ncbi:MAG: polysaccharide deacetylase family protein [Longimicrobiales bacterium]
MRPRRDPVPRAKDAWVWLGGLALLGVLGAGVTGAAVVLWENIDIRQLVPQLAAAAPDRLPLPVPPAPPARDAGSFDAVIFDSPRNEAFFSEPGYYDSALDAWRAITRDLGGVVRMANSADQLRQIDADDVMVLVEAPCLSEDERSAVQSHLAAGGGVVANWAVGARDEACEWLGWQTIADLTGAEDVREIPVREGLFLTLPAGVPLSAGLDAGARVELRPDPALALRLSGPRVYWSDWALNPAPDEDGGGADAAAVATRSAQGGRVAWFAFRHGQGVTATDSLRLRRIFENGIVWAAGTAVATPAAWPQGERAALMVTLDVEDQSANAVFMASMLRDRDVPATFYVVSQLVLADTSLAGVLSAAGEVGSQTSDHNPVLGLTPQDQRFRLRRSWTDVESWTGVAPSGLHPPEETFDANTLAAWHAAGGRYLVATNDGRSASPEVHATPDGTIVVLPRVLRDDYNLIVQDRVIRAASLERAFVDDIRKMHAIGGLAIVASHTQIMRAGPRITAVGAVVDSARAQGDWWLAQGAEVADWWTRRAETRVTFVPKESSTYLGDELEPVPMSDILVEAPTDRGIAGLWIDLLLPRASVSMRPLVDGASVDFEATEWGMRVPVPALTPGGTARISIVRLAAEDGGVR